MVEPGALTALVEECFTGLGIAEDDAATVAEVLVDANLRGLESHGFARVPAYMERVRSGLAGGTEAMSVVASHGAVCRLDAAHALGPASSVKAIDRAVALARDHGCGLVAVGRSTHFGAAGFYARRAAEAGLLAVVASNGPANMAPHGASEPFLGTNAMAIAVPLDDRDPFVFDSSSSIVARGRIIRARALGEPIEPGWAIDPEGGPTVDAAAALAGAVLPAAGPKGSGLAMAISLFATVLGGADPDHALAPMYGSSRPQNVGHVFLVVEPARLAVPGETGPDLSDVIDRLHALRPAEGFDGVRYPGEAGAARARERRQAGIPIAGSELEATARACEESGLLSLAERSRGFAAASIAS